MRALGTRSRGPMCDDWVCACISTCNATELGRWHVVSALDKFCLNENYVFLCIIYSIFAIRFLAIVNYNLKFVFDYFNINDDNNNARKTLIVRRYEAIYQAPK